MRYSTQVEPISYLNANAAEVLVITQNGDARAVLKYLASYEETQATLALQKLVALSKRDVEAGRVEPAAEVAARLRVKRAMV